MIAAVLAVILVATPVMADIGGHLEASTEAEFTGEQVVLCETPDGQRTTVFEVAQRDGTVVAWDESSEESMVSLAPGLSVTSVGDRVEATSVVGSRSAQPDAYTEGDPVATTYLGRPATQVSFFRDGTERVRLVIDEATQAVLRSTTYDAAGGAYCDRRLVSFSTEVGEVPTLPSEDVVDAATPLEATPGALPESAAGLELIDTYAVEEGTLSYYSDGFFSVGVVVTGRPVHLGDGAEVVEVEAARGSYRRSFRAGSAVVAWSSGTENLALITDLPPDMVEDFLEELPEPVDAGFFRRIWSRFFG
ncbi:MAG TPA: hypothetical protein VK011_08470 [Acidimicrobiia bacterium]|nr:hypothetical protein [Acidimicrobiia bacterium]